MSHWRRISSRAVYANLWMSVREDRVATTRGELLWPVVDSPVAVNVAAVTDDAHVYLVGQHRYTTRMYSWELIGGWAEADESPLAAAQRELREEAGLVAEDWQELGPEIHLSNRHCSTRAMLFVARGLTQVDAAPEVTEQLQIRRVAICDLPDFLPGVTDAFTAIGLHRLMQRESSAGQRISIVSP